MKSTSLPSESQLSRGKTHFIRQGSGAPVVLIHGLAASLHDWDDLAPELAAHGYATYALDLLGHGDSHKPLSRLYQMAWVVEHMSAWIDSLHLSARAVLVGHSLGGYLALELARHFPERVRALVLVNPFYRSSQIPGLVRRVYKLSPFNLKLVSEAPVWLVRLVIDLTSLSMGHSAGGAHGLPTRIRAQTARDYGRTAAGVYHLINDLDDIESFLPLISQPCLLVSGSRDRTLPPASFRELAKALPNVTTRLIDAGHVPHQSHADEFNRVVLEFLASLPPDASAPSAPDP